MDVPSDAAQSVARRSRKWAADAKTLAVQTIRDSGNDRIGGLAAEVSFYLLLALPPLLLTGLGLLSYVGDFFGSGAVDSVRQEILDAAGAVFTAETVADTIRPAVDNLLARGRADVLSIAIVLALWSGSRALRVIVQAVTIAYDVEDERTWWQHRLLGLGLTAAGVVAFAILMPLLVVGPEAGETLAGRFGLADTFERVWAILYFPVVAAVGLTLLTWVYHIVPPHYTRWRRDLPGAVLALVIWALGSFGLREYGVRFLTGESAYGYFATPIIALLWVYISAIALLAGAELNAEVEKLWPEEPEEPDDVTRWRRQKSQGGDREAPSPPPTDER